MSQANVSTAEAEIRGEGEFRLPPLTAERLERVRAHAEMLEPPLRDDVFLLIAREEQLPEAES